MAPEVELQADLLARAPAWAQPPCPPGEPQEWGDLKVKYCPSIRPEWLRTGTPAFQVAWSTRSHSPRWCRELPQSLQTGHRVPQACSPFADCSPASRPPGPCPLGPLPNRRGWDLVGQRPHGSSRLHSRLTPSLLSRPAAQPRSCRGSLLRFPEAASCPSPVPAAQPEERPDSVYAHVCARAHTHTCVHTHT